MVRSMDATTGQKLWGLGEAQIEGESRERAG